MTIKKNSRCFKDDIDEDIDDGRIAPIEMEEEKKLNGRSIIRDKLTDYQKKLKDRPLSKVTAQDEFDPNYSGDSEYKTIMEKRECVSKFSATQVETQRRKRTFQSDDEDVPVVKKTNYSESVTPSVSRWDATPAISNGGETPGQWDATPGPTSAAVTPARKRRWDQTPKDTPNTSSNTWSDTPNFSAEKEAPTPGASARRSRWDQTPVNETPSLNNAVNTPSFMTPSLGGATPLAFTPTGSMAMGMATPAHRNGKFRPQMDGILTDDELDELLPSDYEIVPPPANYPPADMNRRLDTPTPSPQVGFAMETPGRQVVISDNQPTNPDLPMLNNEEITVFTMLCEDYKQDEMSDEDQKKLKVQELFHKIKNGTPPMRKSAMRQLTDKAMEFGPELLIMTNIKLLNLQQLEQHERYYLQKVFERIVYKFDDLVKPYVRQIYTVIAIDLIDEDYMARNRSKEIMSSVAKAAGFNTMITILSPDLQSEDDGIRNIASRALALISFTFTLPVIIPFLKAVCSSKKYWQAKQAGFRTVRQIAFIGRCSVQPHITELVHMVKDGLNDRKNEVQIAAADAIAALAEAVFPHGIESFAVVLEPILNVILNNTDRKLIVFLKAMGCIIPLMEGKENDVRFTSLTLEVVIRHFTSNNQEMSKVILRILKLICSCDFVKAITIRNDVLKPFFENFWDNKHVMRDKTVKNQLIDTTVEIANKIGSSAIIAKLTYYTMDDNSEFRNIILEVIQRIILSMGSADIDEEQQKMLMDGMLYTFQECNAEGKKMINSMAIIINSFGTRMKGYFEQIVGTIRNRMRNGVPQGRENACDLMSKVAHVMVECNDEDNLLNLSYLMFEYLGEEYPEVLGSIIGAIKSVFNVVGVTRMNPPIRDLLTRLTPILKNRNEKVQENCINLVGRIADRAAEQVNNKEWMRICFELLELIKAHRKIIRRASVNTFGYIAKAIGPQDVLATLLNNLKVQERQNRVCTTVAIAIVAESCGPYTVLPALMNEYRVPDLNIQNGVLKSLSFLFEYIGPVSKDYIYTVAPLLEDALKERDLVHRQTAMSVIGHVAMGLQGFDREDVLNHLMNILMPNIFETSLHVHQAFVNAIEGMRIALGPAKILQYLVTGLFHPARKVREAYWKSYNSLYVGSQDALVVTYPRIPNNETNNYDLNYLDCIL